MNHDFPNAARSARGLSDLPRAVWVAGGLMSLVTAGLAGALIMKSLPDATPSGSTSVPAALASDKSPSNVASNVAPNVAPNVAQNAVPAAPGSRTQSAPNPAALRLSKSPSSAPQAVHATRQDGAPLQTTRTAVCLSCGTVESVSAVQIKGEGSGLGAVAGGVLGGVLGHQIGGGNGKTAATVLGAIGGGVAGNEVERRSRAETTYDVRVRMEDGSRRVVRQAQSVVVGTQVVVEGNRLRLAREQTRPDAPVRSWNTSTSTGQPS